MGFDERKLRAFLAVVDCGSLGRAAPAVHMTQPTLSRLIQEMENRLGLPLFERHVKGMALTAAGESFVPHARLLLFETLQAVEAMDALRGLRRGTLRVGSVAAATGVVLAPAVAKLLKDAPALSVEFLEQPDGELLEALTSRRIDLMIAAELPPHDEIARIAECRFDDVYTVFCAQNHPLTRKSGLELDDVIAESWVLPSPGTTPRQLFERLVRQAGRTLPRIAVDTKSIGAQVALVSRSRLLGWLPHPLLASEVGSGSVRLLTIGELTLHRRFFVYRRGRGLLPETAKEFLKHMSLIGG